MSQFQGNPQIQAAMVSQLMQGLQQRRGETLAQQGELHNTRMNEARMDASSILSEGFVSQFGPTAGAAVSGMPNAQALSFMKPGSEFFERRRAAIEKNKEEMRRLKRESGGIAGKIAKEQGGIRGFDQTFQRTLSSYANEMANDKVHKNAREAVARALMGNQNRFIQLGAGGTFGIGGAGVGDTRLGMTFDTTYQDRIGMGMTPYAAAKAALESARPTPAVDGQGFFGDAPGFFEDVVDAAEPVGETMGLGGSLLATAAGVGGLFLLSNPVGLFAAGLVALTGVTGLVGQAGDQSEAEVKENVQQALAEYKTDYEGLEAANLITASRSLSALGKGGEKASEGLFLGLQKLFRGVEGSGGDPQQMIDELASLKAEYGVSLEQLHAAAESIMVASSSTSATALKSRQEFENILATEEDASNSETQRLIAEKSEDVRQAHQKLQFKAQAAMAFLEDMGKQTTDTTARFFTAEERADAASELLLGTLETAFDEQGNINPEFEEIFAKLDPRMGQALSDLISNRLGALDRLEGLQEEQMDLAELMDPELSPLVAELENELAIIADENFQANQEAARRQVEEQRTADMLIDEISAGLRFLEQ
tara:strand:+ start:8181 stop:9968 length:1788 start_codon:yes stop_codon:yes gene_type:complete